MRSCSTPGMEVLLIITLLHLKVEGSKTMKGQEWNNSKEVLRRNTLAGEQYPFRPAKYSMIRKFDTNFFTELRTKKRWTGESSLYDVGRNVIWWFTDVSKTCAGMGAGIWTWNQISGSMGKAPNIFQAEVYTKG